MRHNQEEKLLNPIKHGINQLIPEYQEELWTRPVEQAKPSDWYLDSSHAHGIKRNYFPGVVAACLILCMVSVFLFQFMPTASIYLDVNPSVNLEVNYRNRVTKAVACNEDAERILSDMELRGSDLDVALYAILGSMVHHGYLTETQDTILISVHSGNESRAKELKAEVTEVVNQSLEQMIQAGEVLSQQLNGEDLEDDDAAPGKAAFIEELEDMYPQLEKEDLQNMTMDEIISLLEKEDLDYSDYLDNDDNDDDDDVDEDDDDDEDDEDDED